jgi:hypothetical protein
MVILNTAQTMITVDESWTGLVGGPATVSHIHCCASVAPPGSNAPVLFPSLAWRTRRRALFPSRHLRSPLRQGAQLEAGMMYFNVHDAEFPAGEIRGQILPAATPEPASLGLLALGVLLMVVCAPKMRRVLAA